MRIDIIPVAWIPGMDCCNPYTFPPSLEVTCAGMTDWYLTVASHPRHAGVDPASDRQGWRECTEIAGAILANYY